MEKNYEFIEDKMDKAYDKNGVEITQGMTINNGIKNVFVTADIASVLQPFFRTGKFSIRYNYLEIV
jgi:hypothetical protein